MYLKVYWNSRFLKHFQCFLCFSLLELNATHPPKNKGKLIIWIARNKNSGKKSCLPTCLHTHIHMVLYYVCCHTVYLFGQMLEFFYKKTLSMPLLRNRIVFLSLWCHASRGFRGLCLTISVIRLLFHDIPFAFLIWRLTYSLSCFCNSI